MARQTFSVEAKTSRLYLTKETRERIRDLILDLDMDATQVIERAVAELHQREIGQAERDVYAELDAIKRHIGLAPQEDGNVLD